MSESLRQIQYGQHTTILCPSNCQRKTLFKKTFKGKIQETSGRVPDVMRTKETKMARITAGKSHVPILCDAFDHPQSSKPTDAFLYFVVMHFEGLGTFSFDKCLCAFKPLFTQGVFGLSQDQ